MWLNLNTVMHVSKPNIVERCEIFPAHNDKIDIYIYNTYEMRDERRNKQKKTSTETVMEKRTMAITERDDKRLK